ncbi:uncharacterized protein LOC120850155 [Ixodes scapularis]|uniref:uncharacterized protein LOC120850155 n=1 Tax=Ixodes scapularis TaxID=6945 RepID=UPI001C395302|nr:uncharacterized protein LOC120850155 [Ixodes scapularis]
MQLDPELTLEKATNLARQSEAVKKQQVALHKSPEENVDRIFRKDASQQGGKERNGEKKSSRSSLPTSEKVCSRCGNERHKTNKCPAIKATCNKCRRQGHYARVCRSSTTLREVTTSETAFLGTVFTSEGQRWIVQVDVREVSITFKVDTGADVTVIPEKMYKELFKDVSLQNPKKVLKGPSKKSLTVLGVMNETLYYRGKTFMTDIYITKRTLSFFETLLLLSGDVELNPGPMTKAQIEQLGKIETILLELQSGQMTVLGKLAGIEAKQADLERKFDTISLKTNDIEKRVLQIEGSGRKLEAKLDDLENRSRRTNLVFFGVPDNSRSETWEESERLITKICKDVLSLDVLIERAHRLGKHKDGKNRPIVVNFPGWEVKESVLRSAFKFKNTSFSVSEDFSLAVQEKRRQLWNYAKEKRQNRENKVHLNHDKLVINEQTFIWDSETRQPVLYRAPGQPREHE